MSVWELRDVELGAGASAMFLDCGDSDCIARFQEDIFLPLLNDLPELDKETMESLQTQFSALIGNKI